LRSNDISGAIEDDNDDFLLGDFVGVAPKPDENGDDDSDTKSRMRSSKTTTADDDVGDAASGGIVITLFLLRYISY
jgi:hypothetical protein